MYLRGTKPRGMRQNKEYFVIRIQKSVLVCTVPPTENKSDKTSYNAQNSAELAISNFMKN
jgi:hypothetical protein